MLRRPLRTAPPRWCDRREGTGLPVCSEHRILVYADILSSEALDLVTESITAYVKHRLPRPSSNPLTCHARPRYQLTGRAFHKEQRSYNLRSREIAPAVRASITYDPDGLVSPRVQADPGPLNDAPQSMGAPRIGSHDRLASQGTYTLHNYGGFEAVSQPGSFTRRADHGDRAGPRNRSSGYPSTTLACRTSPCFRRSYR